MLDKWIVLCYTIYIVKGVIDMVKCPNCNSTAQVRYGAPALSDNKAIITLPCECGCGCHFDLSYEVGENSETFVHYVDKNVRLIKWKG